MITELESNFGQHYFKEANLSFDPARKEDLQNNLFIEKFVPDYKYKIEKISYMDGMKIYFENGWVIARFSGTEPLLRIFAEMDSNVDVEEVIRIFVNALEL